MQRIHDTVRELRRVWRSNPKDILAVYNAVTAAIREAPMTSTELAAFAGMTEAEFTHHRNLITVLDPLVAESYVRGEISSEVARYIMVADRGDQGEVLRLITSGSLAAAVVPEFMHLHKNGLGIREAMYQVMNKVGLTTSIVERDTGSEPPKRKQLNVIGGNTQKMSDANVAIKTLADAMALLINPTLGDEWSESDRKRFDAVRRALAGRV